MLKLKRCLRHNRSEFWRPAGIKSIQASADGALFRQQVGDLS